MEDNNNNSFWAGSQYQNVEDQKTNVESKQDLSEKDYIANIVNDVLDEKSKNLIEQRNIIKENLLREKQKDATIAEQSNKIKELESIIANLNNNSQSANDNSRLQLVEEELQALRKERQTQAFIPVATVFKKYNIATSDYMQAIKTIEERYGLNLAKNPNAEFAEYALSQIMQNTEPSTVQNGFHQDGQNPAVSAEEQEIIKARNNIDERRRKLMDKVREFNRN